MEPEGSPASQPSSSNTQHFNPLEQQQLLSTSAHFAQPSPSNIQHFNPLEQQVPSTITQFAQPSSSNTPRLNSLEQQPPSTSTHFADHQEFLTDLVVPSHPPIYAQSPDPLDCWCIKGSISPPPPPATRKSMFDQVLALFSHE